jgi:RNase P subunit RPR2
MTKEKIVVHMDTPICPRCGYIYTPGDTLFMPMILSPQTPIWETCVSCGKDFRADVAIIVKFTTRPAVKPRSS